MNKMFVRNCKVNSRGWTFGFFLIMVLVGGLSSSHAQNEERGLNNGAVAVNLVVQNVEDTAEAEANPGGVVPLNDDFDEGNRAAPAAPELVGAKRGDHESDIVAGDRILLTDNELVSATATFAAEGKSGRWRLDYSDTKMKVWMVAAGVATQLPNGHISDAVTLPAGGVTLDLLIEGTATSTTVRDSEIKVIFTSDDGTRFNTAKVKLTVFNLDLNLGASAVDEEDPGSLVPFNDDWDETNRAAAVAPALVGVKKGDHEVDATAAVHRIISTDNELVDGTLTLLPVGLEGKWKVSIPAAVKLWKEVGGAWVQEANNTELDVPTTGLSQVWKVEGLTLSTALKDVELKATYKHAPSNVSYEDLAKLTVFKLDINVSAAEVDEETPGGLVALNDDWDEGNRLAPAAPATVGVKQGDNAQYYDVAATPPALKHRILSTDTELVGATLTLLPAGLEGTWKVTIPSNLKLWKQDGATWVEESSGVEVAVPVGGLSQTWKVEGVTVSAAVNDIDLKATYTHLSDAVEYEDVAKLTVFKLNLDVGASELDEEDPGGYVLINDDWDEGNMSGAAPDGEPKGDNEADYAAGHRIKADGSDDELKDATLTLLPIGLTGKWKLALPTGLKVWKQGPAAATTWGVSIGNTDVFDVPGTGLDEKFKLEGITEASDLELKAIWLPAGVTPEYEDKAKLAVVKFDMDSDVDNTTFEGYPKTANKDRSTTEEAAEETEADLIFSNAVDEDDDGIPGYADGIDKFGNGQANSCGEFTRIQIDIPSPLVLPDARYIFKYSASDPNELTREVGEYATHFTTPVGKILRIW